jgi:hypothetical protein
LLAIGAVANEDLLGVYAALKLNVATVAAAIDVHPCLLQSLAISRDHEEGGKVQ